MTDIQEAFREQHRLSAAFEVASVAAGYADHWDAYRADQRGEAWPEALVQAHAAYIAALHAFYALRDGPRGFLGGKGL